MFDASVLIVDDDLFSRQAVANRLAQLGVNVLQADDGFEAFQVLGKQPVDMCIVDLEMPTLDGFQLLGCIRGHKKLKHLPVIVLTGREDRRALDRALTAGATSYLLKPLNWTAFGEHIRHILSLSSAARAARTPDRAAS